ncbi:MAG: hypothetical protein RIR33_1863 [Pseudomonadota bacterium]|jgi:hypothetical protein
MSRNLLLLLPVIAIGACAAGVPSTEEVSASLQKVTASVLAGADPAAIAIEAPERFAAKWTWRAVHDGKAYSCNADNLLRLPDCSPTT